HAAQDEQVRQGVDDVGRVELAIDADRKAFPGELVDDVEHAESPAIVGPTLDEVIGPDMVRVLGPQPDARSVIHQWNDPRIEAIIRLVDQLTPEAISAELMQLGEECDAVAVVCADHPQVSQTINALHERKVPVIAYITDLSAPSRAGYVGTDNWKLGRTAAYFIANMVRRPGKIATFIGNHRYQCQDFSDASFRSYIREHADAITVL